MAKRMKTVYGTDEIPHLWAHGLEEGRKIRNARRNLFAIGDTLYSYGPHFPIARRVSIPSRPENGGGSQTFYLYTTRRYSVTTRGHRYAAERAMRGNGRRFDIDPTDGAGRSLWEPLAERKGSARPIAEWFQRRIDQCAKDAAKPRIRLATRARALERAAAILEEWREIHSAFRLRIGVGAVRAPGSLDEVRAKYAAEFDALERERKERVKREREEREERERVALAEVLPAWRAGRVDSSSVKIHPMVAGRYVTIRDVPYPVLRLAGEDVETSWGARVPVDEARKALRILGRLLERGDSSESAESIGHYRGMRLEGDTLRIGCHPIPLDEIRAFCDAAGWTFPAPATVPA